MPALHNPRQEIYAQLLAKGVSQQKAYVEAGFKPSLSNPSKLAKDARIVARISELHTEAAKIAAKATEKAADALAIDRQWVMARLKDNAERALQAVQAKDANGNPVGDFKYEGAVANRALELLGKEIGMFIERSENKTVIHTIEPTPVLAEEWVEQHATAH